MKKPTTGQQIALAREQLGISQSELARRLSVTPQSVQAWESDKNTPRAKRLSDIGDQLGVSASWLMGEDRAPLGPAAAESNVEPAFRPFKKASAYPVISWIAAGERSQSPEQYVSGPGLSFESDQNAGEYGYWLEVKGGSMTSVTSPSFLPGTYVLVQPEGFDLVSGKYYIAQHRDGETTFKQYVYDAGREYLVPLNPSFETIKMDDDWDVIGRVIDVKVTGL